MDNNQIENNEVTETPVTTPVEGTTTPVENPTPEVQPPVVEDTPAPEAPTASEVAPSLPVEPQAPVAPEAPVAPQPAPQQPAPQQPAQKNNNVLFIIIVAVLSLLIVVIGAILVVKALGNKKTEGNKQETTTIHSEYTTKEITTNTQAPSTTTRTYTTAQNYTQTTRATKAPETPQPVKNESNVYKVDNYQFPLTDEFEVYTTDQGIDLLADNVDEMLLQFIIYEGTTVVDNITVIDEIITDTESKGYTILEANAGTVKGLNIAYFAYTDGQLYYNEIFIDTQYGDLLRVCTMSEHKFTVDSIVNLVYTIMIQGQKSGPAMTVGFGGGNDVLANFDERLLKK